MASIHGLQISWPQPLNENLIDSTLFEQDGAKVEIDFSGKEKVFNAILKDAKEKGVPFKKHILSLLSEATE